MLVFVVVAAFAAGLVAVGSYVALREYRSSAFEQRATREARLALALARSPLANGRPSEALDVFAEVTAFDAIVVTPQGALSTQPGLSVDIVPPDLRRPFEGLEPPAMAIEIDDEPHLALGGALPDLDAEVYLLASQEELIDSLRQHRLILLIAWVGVVALAGLVGTVVARRTLRPVAAAAAAARSLTEGLLDTRLHHDTDDEFGVLAMTFNEMADALADKIRSLSEARDRERRFTADIAHDLRTPVTALVSATSLIANRIDDVPPGLRRPLELLIRDVERMRRLIEDLLELSRLDASGTAVPLEPVDAGALAQAVIAAIDQERAVHVDIAETMVMGDRRRLQRVLSNLVQNGLQHGRTDVTVRVYPDGDNGVIEVTDRGPGIAPESLPHLFERFYKADSARSHGSSGLGLAIAAEHVKALRGSITAANSPGQGAAFVVRLPLAEDSEPQPVEPAADRMTSPVSAPPPA